MLTPRYHHEATLLPDGSVLVAGGEVVPDLGITSTERYDPDVGWARGDQAFGELYDPDTGTWTSIDPPVPLPYSEPTAPLLPDGRVLFVSIDGSTALYDSASAS